MNIFSGEQFQELCSVYIGRSDDFAFNPRIATQVGKHLNVETIPDNYANPPFIFCYTHRIRDLEAQLGKFRFPFILISHNSDTTIDASYHDFANKPQIFHWFTQNLNTTHPKISVIPIGVANGQWPHGQRDLFTVDRARRSKIHDLYFQFGPSNMEERQRCFTAISRFYAFQNQIPSDQYLDRLAEHRFCISPEGVGVDCHRIWEALLCNCIPIIKDGVFARHIAQNYPVVIVTDWNQVTPDFISRLVPGSVDRRRLEFQYFRDQIIAKAYELYNTLIVTSRNGI
jgi:hypothetical protein